MLDRENRLLRAFTTKDGRWRLPLDVSEVDPRYLAMLMAFEDKRFYEHGGVDYFAIMRAGYLLARHGAIEIRWLDTHDAGRASPGGQARAHRRRQTAPDRARSNSKSA